MCAHYVSRNTIFYVFRNRFITLFALLWVSLMVWQKNIQASNGLVDFCVFFSLLAIGSSHWAMLPALRRMFFLTVIWFDAVLFSSLSLVISSKML